jgi:hypothetical protein
VTTLGCGLITRPPSVIESEAPHRLRPAGSPPRQEHRHRGDRPPAAGPLIPHPQAAGGSTTGEGHHPGALAFSHEPATRPPGLTEQPGSGLTVMRTPTRGPNGCMRDLLRDLVGAFSSHDPAPVLAGGKVVRPAGRSTLPPAAAQHPPPTRETSQPTALQGGADPSRPLDRARPHGCANAGPHSGEPSLTRTDVFRRGLQRGLTVRGLPPQGVRIRRTRISVVLLRGRRRASNLPETMPRNATHSTTRPRVGRVVDLD